MWRDGEGAGSAVGVLAFGLSPRRPKPANRPQQGRPAGQRLAARNLPGTGAAVQEFGTIDARSNVETVAPGANIWRSPLRWNNIRRSKALERI
jgi:hypothetical protein